MRGGLPQHLGAGRPGRRAWQRHPGRPPVLAVPHAAPGRHHARPAALQLVPFPGKSGPPFLVVFRVTSQCCLVSDSTPAIEFHIATLHRVESPCSVIGPDPQDYPGSQIQWETREDKAIACLRMQPNHMFGIWPCSIACHGCPGVCWGHIHLLCRHDYCSGGHPGTPERDTSALPHPTGVQLFPSKIFVSPTSKHLLGSCGPSDSCCTGCWDVVGPLSRTRFDVKHHLWFNWR